MRCDPHIKCAMAVLLIVSSIALALWLAVLDHDLQGGVLWYIAQAFMLAGALFGIDYYVAKLQCGHDPRDSK